MGGGKFRTFASLLVVLALVTAGASPACKFISSGKLPAFDLPGPAAHAHHPGGGPGDDDSRSGGHAGHHGGDACAFCVAFHLNKVIAGVIPQIAPPAPAYQTQQIPPVRSRLDSRFAGSARARAPPLPA